MFSILAVFWFYSQPSPVPPAYDHLLSSACSAAGPFMAMDWDDYALVRGSPSDCRTERVSVVLGTFGKRPEKLAFAGPPPV